MILVNRTYEIITEESAENGDAEERGFLSENESCSFRELVDMLRHGETSSYPRVGAGDWITHYGDPDFRTGDVENTSIHYSHDNPAHNLKYWIKALKAAGYRV